MFVLSLFLLESSCRYLQPIARSAAVRAQQGTTDSEIDKEAEKVRQRDRQTESQRDRKTDDVVLKLNSILVCS